jgi:hypothetical protein
MTHGHDDFETEPVPGLPKELPKGEQILWQGSPDRSAAMRRIFHLRKFMLYAGAVVAWRGITVVYDGGTVTEGIVAAGILAVVCGFAIAVLAFIGHMVARGTVYTITNKRLVMRFGIALPMTVQIPFRLIEGAAVKLHSDDTGDIPITLTSAARVSYIVMWPHVRPWRLLRAQPMLRALPNAHEAADVLAHALNNALQSEMTETADETAAAPRKKARAHSVADNGRTSDLAAAAG